MLKETAQILNDQAVRLAHDGDYEDALLCFSRAIEMESDNSLLWYNMGLTYRDSGKDQEALEALKTAHSIDETDEDTLETLATVCLALGDTDAAKNWCAEGITLDEVNPHFWNTMGVAFFNESDYEMASNLFERAITLNPYYYEALFNLKDTYITLGNSVGAAECKKRLDALDKNESQAQLGIWQ